MRMTQFFLPTLKETPAEAQIVSHRLMLRAGMIRQQAAGIYAWLPLGLRVLRRIEGIVRAEQDAAGAQELLMPTIQPAELWRESGRYDDYGREMLRITDRHERELLYGPTNEEMITAIFRDEIKSYRDLPKQFYHIQWKFRDEIRPRFGVMRGREFLMKDNYSFDIDDTSAIRSYQIMFLSYLRTFSRLGLKAVPMRAATGPIGGNLSHEFVILADTGESQVFCHPELLAMDVLDSGISYGDNLNEFFQNATSLYAATDEMHNPASCPVPADQLVSRRGIEVGHIFHFGTKYSEAMGARVAAPDGTAVAVRMGSYGIGVSRLAGAIIEASHDDAGIIWPDAVAPFRVGLINLKTDDANCTKLADTMYEKLTLAGIDTLYDDRDGRPGAKFADMDLIGLPWQLMIGPRGVKSGTVEIKRRATGDRQEVVTERALPILCG